MSLILSIETSTKVCSAALHNAGNLIAHTTLVNACSHAEFLMVIIDNLFKISPCERKDLNAIAISHGPGSYTGLRIGAAVTKGLCYGLNIPLIAIDTLEAMAYEMSFCIDGATLLCPAIDARRSAIYTLIIDKDRQIKKPTHVAFLDDEAYRKSLPNQPLIFFGDGVTKCKDFLLENKNIRFIEGVLPSAKQIGFLAFAKFEKQDWQEIACYEPYYLSQF
ncbi:tRNA (adenosine(37)-N6)-threonylcarbamoyltransferase complex dimerization subunit type 1 TsaB [Cardinium endosymbiont of Culicoides punctatus]|uniref:tRNA (adenosine(37)-N6)-threonylcarbamoyltransferase complex dimerization subunit type 1 TsaB n=1 Tax=Cardinium endosymbiont of Culicoides punctatus TaxID=2304601 RepID=UPI00105901E9|nr:tRNA (adenosine(37)-N6)-threonylcarbamoyltransferase complex dimerization subunit type 1 TsaB [Cardinium endosymbiont of Culicoides punctatus]TDG95469.1 tRNA threonylcarbamoyladenosine biosynthesis protein TsaB [Cardinium endosymbiont of Culicoides punctatus]